MSIRVLLNQLKESDIHIEIKDSKLKLNAPQGKLTPALLEKLKNRKQEIIDFLQRNIQSQVDYASIEPTEKKEYYALSSAQKRMYFLQQLDLESTVYNISSVIPIPGHLDLEKLENNFNKLIDRHESLRTSFEMVQEILVQKIHRQVDFNIQSYNGIDDFSRPFDLLQAPLLRAGIIDPGTGGRLLAVDMHHIISDGISERIMRWDFMALYRSEHLSLLRLQYKDYTEWHNNNVQQEAYKKQETYWLELFSGDIPVLDLPTDYPRPSFQSFAGSSIFFEIPDQETALLKEMALKKELTLYMILLSLLTILMSKLSGQEDIVIGIPIAGRTHADLQGIIGMFVNTLAMRNQPTSQKTIEFFMQEVKQRVLEAFKNQDYPFEDLVEKVVSTRDAVRNPLFDVMFALQNLGEYPGNESSPNHHEDRQQTSTGNKKRGVSRFDMSWTAVETGNRLIFSVEFCTKLFNETTIYRFINYFKRIIASGIQTPGKRISGIEILSEEERKEILVNFNNTKKLYPKKTIHQLFEEQAEETPDHIAVIMDGPVGPMHNRNNRQAVTYKELNQRAGHLAIILREKGFKPGGIAGIMIERSIQLIAAMLAILKSSSAYLPLDRKLPQERMKYMLADSNAQILVTTSLLAEEGEKVRRWEGEKIFLEPDYCPGRGEVSSPASNQDVMLPSALAASASTLTSTCRVSPSNLAYIMYTSGSTGKPKGVMIEHVNVVRLVKNSNFIHWVQGDRLLPTGGLAFDISTFEIWGPLLNGATLFLVEEKIILDAGKLAKTISENNISILHLVPQLFNQLLLQSFEIFAGLKYFLIGGDLVRGGQVNELRIRYTDLKVLHMYGPTENTTFSTCLPVTEFCKTSIPIGKPIANSTVYIVDKYNKLVPVGITGELIVGGDGVARGYLNRPELTAEKFCLRRSGGALLDGTGKDHMPLCIHAFIHYPIPPSPHSPIYRTGDLGRWLPDGNIEFMGRIDFQVKIRGQRIEIGEIECQLLKHEGIKEAVVLAKENNDDKFLCAYIVPVKEFEISGLREYLSLQLPDYMIPAYFIPMENLPLTSTGKIDRKVLPAPDIKSSERYTPPGNDREETLRKIWSQVLGIEQEKIGIHDNFFEIGGNSLNLIMLVGKINKELSIEMPISQIYRHPTIRDIEKTLVSKDFSEQPVTLLNRLRPKKLFCFPDQFGWGYGYKSLASLLEDYSVYAFVFIEEEDRLSKYVDIIKKIQPVGPYVIFGHSAAGRLSFEVARALEKRGCEVSDIIFADCVSLEEWDLNVEKEIIRIGPLLEAFTAEWNAEFIKDKIEKKAKSHMTYLSRGTKSEIINANVHLILSEEVRQRNDIDLRCWEKLTTKMSRVYNGWGRHVDMLWGADLEKNVKIIRKILDGIVFGKE